MNDEFILTHIAHRGCKQCANCADSARITARATGSVEATHRDGEHTATVQRATQPLTQTRKRSEFANGYQAALADITRAINAGGVDAAAKWISDNVDTETRRTLEMEIVEKAGH